MTATISTIGSEISEIISKRKKIKVTEEERINLFLDAINEFKDKINDSIHTFKQLEELFTKLTWKDISDPEDEKLLKELIHSAKKFHSLCIKEYANMRSTFWPKNICRSEITAFKNCLDDYEESVFEVEEIFFTFRKDDELNAIFDSL